jgi:hypothetical protein
VNFDQRAVLAKVVVDLMGPIARRALKSIGGKDYRAVLRPYVRDAVQVVANISILYLRFISVSDEPMSNLLA